MRSRKAALSLPKGPCSLTPTAFFPAFSLCSFLRFLFRRFSYKVSLGTLPSKKRFQSAAPAAVLHAASHAHAMGIQSHPEHRGKFWFGENARHLGHRRRPRQAQRTPQRGFRDVENSREACTTAAEHAASGADIEVARLAQILPHHFKELASTWFQDFTDETLRHHSRRPVADRRHFHFVGFRNERDHSIAIDALDLLRFDAGSGKAYRQIAREMVSADGDHGRVDNR